MTQTQPQKSLEAPHRRLEQTPPRIVEKAAVLGYRTLAAILRHTPPRLSASVIAFGSRASYLAWPSKRRFSNRNYARVLGTHPDDPRVRSLALRAYGEYAKYMVELMRLPSRPVAELESNMVGDGIDLIMGRWAESGRSMIITAGHVGNNEAIAAAIASRGYPSNVVADDSAFPEIFEILRQEREQFGLHVIPWRNLKDLFKALRNKEIVALLVDWGYRADGVPVQLFGSWTALPAGPAVLAAKTGALIAPLAIRRTPAGKFYVESPEPWTVASGDPATVQANTQRIADWLEKTVAAAPDQWYSFKPIWPETAEEEAELAARAALMQAGQPDPGPGYRPEAPTA